MRDFLVQSILNAWTALPQARKMVRSVFDVAGISDLDSYLIVQQLLYFKNMINNCS